MKRLTFAAMLIVSLLATAPISASDPQYWFQARGMTFKIELSRLDPLCQWNENTDNKIQVSGTCGQPIKRNHIQVLFHNHWCDWAVGCAGGAGYDGSMIANLRAGDWVRIGFEGKIYNGIVIRAWYIANSIPQPQDEFECAGKLCGTAVVSYGKWLATPNRMGYWLVRYSLQ